MADRSNDPTRDEIEREAAAIRSEWSTMDRRTRGYRSDIDGYFHLAALILGADKRRADRLFRGIDESYVRPTVRSSTVEVWE